MKRGKREHASSSHALCQKFGRCDGLNVYVCVIKHTSIKCNARTFGFVASGCNSETARFDDEAGSSFGLTNNPNHNEYMQ